LTNILLVIEQLNNIMVKQHIIVDQLAEGLQITRFVKMKFILNSLRIKNSTALLTISSITVREFLIQCSHCTDNYLQRELNWRDETLSMYTKTNILEWKYLIVYQWNIILMFYFWQSNSLICFWTQYYFNFRFWRWISGNRWNSSHWRYCWTWSQYCWRLQTLK